MKIKCYHLILAATVFLLAGCQSDNFTTSDKIEQRLIFQQYHIQYDSEKETLSAKVIFTENNPTGITVKLAKPSSISLNGIALEGDKTEDKSYFYSYSSEGESPISLHFNYVNNTGISFANDLTLSFIEPEISKLKVSKQNGATIPFNGNCFLENELLYCSLSKGTEIAESISLESPENQTIHIYPEDIIDFEEGDYELRFHRFFHTMEIEGSERGGLIESEYISKIIKVTIVE